MVAEGASYSTAPYEGLLVDCYDLGGSEVSLSLGWVADFIRAKDPKTLSIQSLLQRVKQAFHIPSSVNDC